MVVILCLTKVRENEAIRSRMLMIIFISRAVDKFSFPSFRDWEEKLETVPGGWKTGESVRGYTDNSVMRIYFAITSHTYICWTTCSPQCYQCSEQCQILLK